MLRFILWFFAAASLLLLLPGAARAQSPQSRPLQLALARTTTDTARVLLLADLAATYRYSRFDSVSYYAHQGLRLARRIGYVQGEGRCLSRLAILPGERGNLPQALRLNLAALRLNEESQDLEATARTLNQTGLLYFALDDYRPALRYSFRALRLYQQAGTTDTSQLISVIANLGANYEGLRRYDSAAFYLNQAWQLTSHHRPRAWSCWGNPAPYVLRELGLLQLVQGQPRAALKYYRRSARAAEPENDQRSASRAYQYLAELYARQGQSDSSIWYARHALYLAANLPYVVGVVRNSALLMEAYEARQRPDSALYYTHVLLAAQDSLFNPRRIKQLDLIAFNEHTRLLELEAERAKLLARVRTAALLMGAALLLLALLLLWRRNRQQRHANHSLGVLHEQLGQQARELTTQRDDLVQTLKELKITQGQLVLREKMASLGELMAGVAHEIQRPVSLLRRYAAASTEICNEMRHHIGQLQLPLHQQELADKLLDTMHQNQTHIVQYGQRADSVVRGMLEYSQGGGGARQSTDLNALAEEFLRLVYHDLRAKNRYFSAALLLRPDPTLERVMVVRQDVGRALVGVFSAALQAVAQRQRQPDEDYVPQVELTTRRTAASVEIRVRDNGEGLPPEMLLTVFQRFPAGAETGLSLALSHDLITRGHGGTLSVSSQPGRGTEYCIVLPLPSA
ncbi:tetratricopeptide repeat-containing sensor histidine kinase [Hymenobacter psychrophilus]|uniref:histidine kinase n=1 Tax=Hymenobacter psychrophilus TaxID=651662 RepID=A0A1H3LRE3_9BACT|nr:ATP-binding protein [Hymenobacter psychrophilus]SDY67127.1 Histidine kinase-, DNA gyrase B-, and HSP90-like ATPase [Hymenobacter psychrophilus]